VEESPLSDMRRREFITLLGGAAAAWPLGARAQQAERVRRIGVLTSGATADDPDGRTRRAAFLQGLQQLGWIDGRNIEIDYRWGAGDADSMHKYAAELVALAPDVILASGTATVAPLLQATRTVPIVFVQVTIRSEPGSSKAWRGPAATPPVSLFSSMASAENGWSCSRRSRRP
jgi:ABC-type uncharacterized transport system substrate-binding protein